VPAALTILAARVADDTDDAALTAVTVAAVATGVLHVLPVLHVVVVVVNTTAVPRREVPAARVCPTFIVQDAGGPGT